MTEEFKQMVIDTLRRGDELPRDWARELFPPEKREYELVYHDKQREEDVIADTTAVPLQLVSTFGKSDDGWHNKLIFGDNLQVMKSLLEFKKNGELCNENGAPGVRLVYIDPPFATKRDFSGSSDEKAYQDKIAGAAFVEFLRKRFILIRELLSEDGVILVHLDWRKVHYLKVVLDEIFQEQDFVNEIIWRSTNAHNTKTSIGQIHQTILCYRRKMDGVFNPIRRPHFKEHTTKNYRHKDKRGNYSHCDLTGPGIRTGDSGKPWKGYDPTASGRHWQPPSSLYDQLEEDISERSMLKRLDYFYGRGYVYLPAKGGQPRGKLYLTPDGGNLIQDIWAYQPYTSGIYNGSKECIDEDVQWLQNPEGEVEYPTQKPEGVLARILRIWSNEGDLVLDAFAGSGTTCAVAEKLNRRWIGIDSGKLAVYSTQRRMLNLKSEIGNTGRPLRPKSFTLYNAGLYDFSSLRQLAWPDWRFFALQLFGCKDEPHTIGGLALDGRLKGGSVLVFNHVEHPGKRIDEETIQNIHLAVGKKIGRKFFIIAPRGVFDFQQDYVDLDGVRYYALRIPYSVINELHHRDFTALKQPNDESAVNDTVDAVGFDFIQPPQVEWNISVKKRHGEMFDEACLKIKRFESRARIRGKDTHGGFETMSMLMLDFDYDGKVFDLDAVFYANQLETNEWQAWFAAEKVGEKLMAVFIDIYGNEARELITRDKLGFRSKKSTKSKKKLRK